LWCRSTQNAATPQTIVRSIVRSDDSAHSAAVGAVPIRTAAKQR
jgi:hypothetical protein